MSTPTDQFANLSIEPEEEDNTMTQNRQVLQERAVELQDILSSFDEKELPAEFQPHYFSNITGRRPPPLRLQQSEWTVQGNLHATLLQWGSYNDEGWNFLSQIQSPTSRAIAFFEKLNRRFEECLDEYDDLEDAGFSASMIKDRLSSITDKIYELAEALYEDRQRRELCEIDTLKVALRALASICERSQILVPSGTGEGLRRTSRRTSSLSETDLSLFASVIKHKHASQRPFMIGALQLFSGAALKTCLKELIAINGLLNSKGAGDAYISRFESLQQKANDESQNAPRSTGGGSSGRSSGLEAEPRPGSKRPNPTVETTPKRGKRSTGK